MLIQGYHGPCTPLRCPPASWPQQGPPTCTRSPTIDSLITREVLSVYGNPSLPLVCIPRQFVSATQYFRFNSLIIACYLYTTSQNHIKSYFSKKFDLNVCLSTYILHIDRLLVFINRSAYAKIKPETFYWRKFSPSKLFI